jgi:hypothetical protein
MLELGSDRRLLPTYKPWFGVDVHFSVGTIE